MMQPWKLEPARDLGMPLGERLRSLRRECGLIETAAHLCWGALTRTYFALAHRLTVRGQEHLPAAAPFILAANHASHLDALVLASVLPWRLRDRIFPVAAGDTFFQTPLLAAFAAGVLNALPMWRRNCGPHALLQLRQRLVEEPCAYILFPEGTRSRDGKIGRFKCGLGMLAAEANVPVVPCHLDGTFAALPPHSWLPRWRKITLTIGEPLCFATTPNERDGWEEIAQTVEGSIRRLGGVELREGFPSQS
ncbi:MAG TPA: lysophospholipid acyltransferase family protein [Gemmataceae bacterium]|nr:lysophospholipid acyltransferase family protein [Gemmataceae bacterium]